MRSSDWSSDVCSSDLLTPDIPVVAEESAAAGDVPDVSGGRFWLVDPLDGTKEFIHKRGDFTVNIGLIDAGRPVLGVVHTPVDRSEERRVGKECVSTCRSRWSPYH